MFSQRLFQISWLDCEQYGKNQGKGKGTQATWFNVQNVVKIILLFKCHRSIDFYLFILSQTSS